MKLRYLLFAVFYSLHSDAAPITVHWDGCLPVYALDYRTSLNGPWRHYSNVTNYNPGKTNHFVQAIASNSPTMLFRVSYLR